MQPAGLGSPSRVKVSTSALCRPVSLEVGEDRGGYVRPYRFAYGEMISVKPRQRASELDIEARAGRRVAVDRGL